MDECFEKELRKGTARMKVDKETEEEGNHKASKWREVKWARSKESQRYSYIPRTDRG